MVQQQHKSAAPAGQVGDYRALKTLGEGGFGSVVEAERTSTGERVALKELARISPDALARFKQEFRALQGLHHPNLVRLEELFEHEGRWFIAMELVDGSDWLEWVRPHDTAANDNATPFDVDRLRDTLGDIARGLFALHEAGFVHRDLKPANMRVTQEGRAVLLDFGLLTQTDVEAQSTHGAGIGTVAYMAPEQAAGQKVGPAADWYALGTSLYEALTGRLPFTGEHVLAVMMAKQGKLPPAPSAACGDRIPQRLEALTMHLLAPLPEERAHGGDVLRSVVEQTEAPPSTQTHLAPTMGVMFAGRTAELEALEHAFDRTRRGEPRQVFVEGESGIGKSALVEEFLRQLGYKHPDTVVLRGRCFENESVPFKGMDGVMDSLARYLRRLPEPQCRDVLPRWAKVLAELFPVMGGVRLLADKRLRDIPAEPFARRRAAIATLGELFAALCDEHPLVVVVDDVQWADTESFPLFEALAANSGLLLLFTVRQQQEVPEAIRPALDALRGRAAAHQLWVGGLRRSEAREFAAQLLGPASPPEWASRIAGEAQGHPLFVAELVRHVLGEATGGGLEDLTLDDVLATRIGMLGEAHQRMLQLIACADSPKALAPLQRASSDANAPDLLAALKADKLVRSGNRGRVQCYHDKVRAVVLSGLREDRAREFHLRWAQALAADDEPDAAEVGLHFERAGLIDQALDWLERAADRALENLGFAQAERLYTRCLDLGSEAKDDARLRWLVGTGHACARGGRSTQAADYYQQAAPLADREDAVRLRVWAAQHLLQSAQVDEGLEAARAALAEVGIRMPPTEAAGLRTLLWQRLKLRLRGMTFTPKPADQVSDVDRLVLHALHALSAPVSFVQMMVGAALGAQHLTRALAVGDCGHAAHALALEAVTGVALSPERYDTNRTRLDEAAHLADENGGPASRAIVELSRGTAALIVGENELAAARIEEAERLLLHECGGEPWTLTNVRSLRSTAWALSGDHATLAERVSHWVSEAEDRGDRFALTVLNTVGSGWVRWLRDDRPELCQQELERVMAFWPSSTFSHAHLTELGAQVGLRNYLGGQGVWQWLESRRPKVDRELLARHGTGKNQWMGALTGAALAQLSSPGGHTHSAAKRALRQGVAHLTNARGSFRVVGVLSRAQELALSNEVDGALRYCREAHDAAATTARVLRPAAAYLSGLLVGGSGGSGLRRQATEFFRHQGYAKPQAALRMYLPALDRLDAKYG